MPVILKPCPFCGGAACIVQEGTVRWVCIVACDQCGATLESDEEGIRCGGLWNDREVPADPNTYTIEVDTTRGRVVVRGPIPLDHLVGLLEGIGRAVEATVVDAVISSALGVTMACRREDDEGWREEALGLVGGGQ